MTPFLFFQLELRPWGLLTSAGFVASAATIFGFLGRFSWFLDLFSHFRVQYMPERFVVVSICAAKSQRSRYGLLSAWREYQHDFSSRTGDDTCFTIYDPDAPDRRSARCHSGRDIVWVYAGEMAESTCRSNPVICFPGSGLHSAGGRHNGSAIEQPHSSFDGT